MTPRSGAMTVGLARFRILWAVAGTLALALGVVGIVLPLLPTTPFVLLAAFCYARSSPRLHRWLVTHRRFGPEIEAWRSHGAISAKGRTMAVLMMAAALLISLLLGISAGIIALQVIVMVAVASFILTRPLPPR